MPGSFWWQSWTSNFFYDPPKRLHRHLHHLHETWHKYAAQVRKLSQRDTGTNNNNNNNNNKKTSASASLSFKKRFLLFSKSAKDRSSLSIATHCESLRVIASHCESLRVIASHCQSLPVIASHCQSANGVNMPVSQTFLSEVSAHVYSV